MAARVKDRPADSPWFTLDEACAYGRMGRDEMGELLRSGVIKGHQAKPGGRWRIHRDAIDAYLAGEEFTSTAPAVARRHTP